MDRKTIEKLLQQKEREIEELKRLLKSSSVLQKYTDSETSNDKCLSKKEIERYSRQLLLREIGMEGQLALKRARVLIVGAGGLGCPAGIYLAAAGVGKIGIVDYDNIELNNLHRQILHKQINVGIKKSDSFRSSLLDLNDNIECAPHHVLLNSKNIGDIITQYDIVIDASDNVATRYLLNDACVLYKKPLISGSALGFQGQLTIYNYRGSPCYRCLFPVPPPAHTVTNCSEGGVLGVVPGIIGSLQALEAIKMILNIDVMYAGKFLLFDAETGFRVVKLRSQRPQCKVCGINPTVTELIDYEAFCGGSACDKIQNITLLSEQERVTCQDYKFTKDSGQKHILIDVRTPQELQICSLPNSINIPFSKIESDDELVKLSQCIKDMQGSDDPIPAFVICRRGNNSQRAVRILKEKMKEYNVVWRDLKGGLTAWADEVDKNFPVY